MHAVAVDAANSHQAKSQRSWMLIPPAVPAAFVIPTIKNRHIHAFSDAAPLSNGSHAQQKSFFGAPPLKFAAEKPAVHSTNIGGPAVIRKTPPTLDHVLAWTFAYVIGSSRHQSVDRLCDDIVRCTRQRFFVHELVEVMDVQVSATTITHSVWPKKRRLCATAEVVEVLGADSDDPGDNLLNYKVKILQEYVPASTWKTESRPDTELVDYSSSSDLLPASTGDADEKSGIISDIVLSRYGAKQPVSAVVISSRHLRRSFPVDRPHVLEFIQRFCRIKEVLKCEPTLKHGSRQSKFVLGMNPAFQDIFHVPYYLKWIDLTGDASVYELSRGVGQPKKAKNMPETISLTINSAFNSEMSGTKGDADTRTGENECDGSDSFELTPGTATAAEATPRKISSSRNAVSTSSSALPVADDMQPVIENLLLTRILVKPVVRSIVRQSLAVDEVDFTDSSLLLLPGIPVERCCNFLTLYHFLLSHRMFLGLDENYGTFRSKHLYAALTTQNKHNKHLLCIFYCAFRCLVRLSFKEHGSETLLLDELDKAADADEHIRFFVAHAHAMATRSKSFYRSTGKTIRDWLLYLPCVDDADLSTLVVIFLWFAYPTQNRVKNKFSNNSLVTAKKRKHFDVEQNGVVDGADDSMSSDSMHSDAENSNDGCRPPRIEGREYIGDCDMLERVMQKLIVERKHLTSLLPVERLALLDFFAREIIDSAAFKAHIEKIVNDLPVHEARLQQLRRDLTMLNVYRQRFARNDAETNLTAGLASIKGFVPDEIIVNEFLTKQSNVISADTTSGSFVTNGPAEKSAEPAAALTLVRRPMSARVKSIYELQNRKRLNLRSRITRSTRAAPLDTSVEQVVSVESDEATIRSDIQLLWDDLLQCTTLSEHERNVLREALVQKLATLEPQMIEQYQRTRSTIEYIQAAVAGPITTMLTPPTLPGPRLKSSPGGIANWMQTACDHSSNIYAVMRIPSDYITVGSTTLTADTVQNSLCFFMLRRITQQSELDRLAALSPTPAVHAAKDSSEHAFSVDWTSNDEKAVQQCSSSSLAANNVATSLSPAPPLNLLNGDAYVVYMVEAGADALAQFRTNFINVLMNNFSKSLLQYCRENNKLVLGEKVADRKQSVEHSAADFLLNSFTPAQKALASRQLPPYIHVDKNCADMLDSLLATGDGFQLLTRDLMNAENCFDDDIVREPTAITASAFASPDLYSYLPPTLLRLVTRILDATPSVGSTSDSGKVFPTDPL